MKMLFNKFSQIWVVNVYRCVSPKISYNERMLVHNINNANVLVNQNEQ